jgi:uncharacterized membrane protein
MSGPRRRSPRCPCQPPTAEIGLSVLGSTIQPQHVEGQNPEDDEAGSGLGRLLAFSDSVFAVSITLLVFDLSVRSGLTQSGASHALSKLIPQMLVAALSFAIVGTFWLAHHRAFTQVKRWDGVLLRLNLLSLAPIVFIPFATQLQGEYGSFKPGVVIYSCTVAIVGLLFTVVWLYAASGHRLISESVSHQRVVNYALRTASVATVFGLCAVVAALGWPKTAEYLWLAVIIPLVLLRIPAVQREVAAYGTPCEPPLLPIPALLGDLLPGSREGVEPDHGWSSRWPFL